MDSKENNLEQINRETTRKGIAEGLLAIGEMNPNVVVLSADLASSVGADKFKEKFPERFIEIGVAEQNMASVASGLSAMGKIPFITSYSIFNPGRNWEQIRTNICYNNSNVKIIGSHAGLTVGEDGASHQMLEDIALMRVLPRMSIIAPCDYIETKKAVIEAMNHYGPTYIRVERDKTPVITSESSHFNFGKVSVVFDWTHDNYIVGSENIIKGGHKNSYTKIKNKTDVVIFSYGPILYEAIVCAKKLKEEEINVKVVNVSTIKPLDENVILSFMNEAGAGVVIENHQSIGGLGSAISELIVKHHYFPLEVVAVKDKFGESGKPSELLKLHGLTNESLIKVVKRAILRKR